MNRKDTILFATFLLVIGFLVLLTVGLADHEDSNWWAAWGQWVGGVGSIAAAGAAVWIAVVGWRKSAEIADKQSQRTEELAAKQAQSVASERHREQASKFGVWIEREESPVTWPGTAQRPSTTIGYASDPVVKYHNGSLSPMYDVCFIFDYGEDGFMRHSFVAFTLGPTNEPVVHRAATAEFREKVNYQVRSRGELEPLEVVAAKTKMIAEARVEASFRDGNNSTWKRAKDGTLEPT